MHHTGNHQSYCFIGRRTIQGTMKDNKYQTMPKHHFRAFVHGLVNNLKDPSYKQSFMPNCTSANAVTECVNTETPVQPFSPTEKIISLPVMSESWWLETASSQPTAIRENLI